ncbi:MAG: SH3 domain-containing protein [Bacteroidota bacterium]
MNKFQKSSLLFRQVSIVLMLFVVNCAIANTTERLATADSLFNKGKYTESLDIYLEILEDGKYSPSMLLKLAYIQEGLGDVSGALYYLNLYYNETSNKQALVKLEEIAKEHQLIGYEFSDLDFFANLYHRFQYQTIGAMGAISLFLLTMSFYSKKKKGTKPVGFVLAHVFSLVILFALINFGDGSDQGIIVDQRTYLMTGPSAGADVVEVLEQGHKVRILGREGVWVKIVWGEEEVYIRESKIKSLS